MMMFDVALRQSGTIIVKWQGGILDLDVCDVLRRLPLELAEGEAIAWVHKREIKAMLF